MSDVVVTRDPEASRYLAHVDGVLAGRVDFQLATDVLVLAHTEVDRAFEGRGVGSALARTVLDEARTEGNRKVLIICPFLIAWIGRNPEYADLLYGSHGD